MKVLVIGLLAVASLAACKPLPSNEPQDVTDTFGKTFFCEDDGELVEQHIGVKNAYAGPYGTERWRIVYVDGTEAFYRQPEGETCKVVPTTLFIE